MLSEQVICKWCAQLATEDDHIVPLAFGGADYDRANHQGLCHECHALKTRAESRAAREMKAHGSAPTAAFLLDRVVALLPADHAARLRQAYTSALSARD